MRTAKGERMTGLSAKEFQDSETGQKLYSKVMTYRIAAKIKDFPAMTIF